MRNAHYLGAAAVTVLALAPTTAAIASTTTRPVGPVALIENVAAEVLDGRASLAVSPVGDAIYTSPTTDITVELTQDGRFSISEDTSTDLSIMLLAPTSDSIDVDGGLLGFEHNDGSSTVPVVKDDGSVQVTSVIESPSAPLDYNYEVTAGPGSSLELLEDGSVFIRDGAGEYAGAIAAPWAKDSVGAAAPTRHGARASLPATTGPAPKMHSAARRS